MPRAKKTISGAPAQAVKSVPGQRYGEGVQQAAMQQAMPAPNVRQAAPPQPAPTQQAMPTAQPAPQAMPQQPVDVGGFLQQLPKNLLGQNGNGPVTAGLPFGPGSNSIPSLRTPLNGLNVDMLQRMYDITGNPRIRALLERAKS